MTLMNGESDRGILLVDSDAIRRDTLSAQLGTRYPLLTAETGDDALALLETHAVGVCIGSSNLPDMDVYKLMGRLEQRWPDTVRVIIHSSNAQNGNGTDHGVEIFRYLIRPWSPAELYAVVDSALVVHRLFRERRRLQANLATAEASATMGFLAAHVGHEIRNALVLPSGVLSLLAQVPPRFLELAAWCERLQKEGLLPKELEPLVTSLSGGHDVTEFKQLCEGATRSLTDALEMAKALAEPYRKPNGGPQRVETSKFVEITARAGKMFMLHHNTDLEVVPAEVPACAADPMALRQIVLNLLRNAAEATPPGPPREPVRLKASCADDYVCIDVEDHGVGVPPENIGRLFQPLFTTKEDGTGIGLATCRDLARQMGGDVVARSELGKGSTFTVKVPVWRAA